MGGVGFPASGELGYPGSDRPGCGGSAHPQRPARPRPPTPPAAGTHPVNGRLAIAAEAAALPIELLSRLREEERPCRWHQGTAATRHPRPVTTVPLQYLVIGSGVARGRQVLAHALLQPVPGIGGGRSGGLGGTEWVLGPRCSVLPALEIRLRRVALRGRGGQCWRQGPVLAHRGTPAWTLTSVEYARLRPWRGSCWLGAGPG